MNSLFPDHSVLETGRNEAQAIRLSQQLREVDLQMLATDADRRQVVARLRREGIADAMGLILLTEDEVLRWRNVGPVFVEILAQMRRQLVADPERIASEWYNKHRLLVLPDDLNLHAPQDDFFGYMLPSLGEEDSTSGKPLSDDEVTIRGAVEELERCLVAAIEMLQHRGEDGIVLRKYFIEGLSAQRIAAQEHLASAQSVHRIVKHHFTLPLLRGYQVRGIQFSDQLIDTIRRLRRALQYTTTEQLAHLERITPQRFLEFLGLTLLGRTLADSYWGVDYIVPLGSVELCRRTQRLLLSALQWRVVAVSESTIRRSLRQARPEQLTAGAADYSPAFLRVLLRTHPCIERSSRGVRLVAERLGYESARIARIVYDAHGPITLSDIMAQYERRYMQRPQHLSLSHIRRHFPRVHSLRRGVWTWGGKR